MPMLPIPDTVLTRCRDMVLYFDVLQLAPLFNLSFDPNIKTEDPYAYRKEDIQLWRECQEHSATYRNASLRRGIYLSQSSQRSRRRTVFWPVENPDRPKASALKAEKHFEKEAFPRRHRGFLIWHSSLPNQKIILSECSACSARDRAYHRRVSLSHPDK